MSVYISTHFVVKENTNLGKKFVIAALNSAIRAGFSNEIIFIDNGCNPDIRDACVDILDKAENDGLTVRKMEAKGLFSFGDLRTMAFNLTSPFTDWIVWRDSDEITVPESWADLPGRLRDVPRDVGRILCRLQHLMINPTLIQAFDSSDTGIPKDCIVRYSKNGKWKKGVHERYETPFLGVHDLGLPYVHLGYCRAQWRTFLKWLRYAVIEHGNTNVYKNENIEVDEGGAKVLRTVPWLRDWRTPDTILEDRRKVSKPYTGPVPVECEELFRKAREGDWRTYLRSLDSEAFWDEWQEKSRLLGGWPATLDWVQAEQEKIQWTMI